MPEPKEMVWFRHPHTGATEQAEATEAAMVPLMVRGYQQIQPPVAPAEEGEK